MLRVIHPNRWFFWTIALLLAIGLALVAAIFSAQREFEEEAATLASDFTSNWKTFRSQSLGISIIYPSSWQVETDPAVANVVSLENPRNFEGNVTISVVDPKFEKIIRESLNTGSERDILVDNVAGKWLVGKDSRDAATSNVVFLRRDGKLYYIAGQTPVFEKMLRSLKFL